MDRYVQINMKLTFMILKLHQLEYLWGTIVVFSMFHLLDSLYLLNISHISAVLLETEKGQNKNKWPFINDLLDQPLI